MTPYFRFPLPNSSDFFSLFHGKKFLLCMEEEEEGEEAAVVGVLLLCRAEKSGKSCNND